MLEFNARAFMNLAREIEEQDTTFFMSETEGASPLDDEELKSLRGRMVRMAALAAKLEMPTLRTLLDARKETPPSTLGEWRMLIEVMYAELEGKLFLFVPPHRSKFFKVTVPEKVYTAFPFASRELQDSGRCIAMGQWTASVFHSMRAGEIGVRALSDSLGVRWTTTPAELIDWHKHQTQIAAKLSELKQQPRSIARDNDLGFYSQAAAQLQYFNDGWRIRVAHSRATYNEGEAITALSHSADLIVAMAERFKEPGV